MHAADDANTTSGSAGRVLGLTRGGLSMAIGFCRVAGGNFTRRPPQIRT